MCTCIWNQPGVKTQKKAWTDKVYQPSCAWPSWAESDDLYVAYRYGH